MSFKHLAAFACVVVLAACSDNPVSPPEKPTAAVAKDPAPVIAVPSADDHSARFEFYFKGQLQRVLRGSEASSPENFGDLTDTDFGPLVEMMDKRAANSRTARVANLLRGLDKIPANARAAAFEARAKALMNETPHALTKLPDGTRIIEFRFDGQLAGRAVIPATVTVAGSKHSRATTTVGGEVGVIGMTTATGDECYDCWTEADEIYYWGIATYLMDQGAAIEADASFLTYASPAAAFDISIEGNCLKQYYAFISSSIQFSGVVVMLGSNWESLSAKLLNGTMTPSQIKLGKLMLIDGGINRLQAMWAAWNAYHDCLWKNW